MYDNLGYSREERTVKLLDCDRCVDKDCSEVIQNNNSFDSLRWAKEVQYAEILVQRKCSGVTGGLRNLVKVIGSCSFIVCLGRKMVSVGIIADIPTHLAWNWRMSGEFGMI